MNWKTLTPTELISSCKDEKTFKETVKDATIAELKCLYYDFDKQGFFKWCDIVDEIIEKS